MRHFERYYTIITYNKKVNPWGYSPFYVDHCQLTDRKTGITVESKVQGDSEATVRDLVAFLEGY